MPSSAHTQTTDAFPAGQEHHPGKVHPGLQAKMGWQWQGLTLQPTHILKGMLPTCLLSQSRCLPRGSHRHSQFVIAQCSMSVR